MIDPVTALAAVNSAVSLIKKAAATVDDVRSLGPLLGKYYDAKSQAVQAARQSKKKGGSNMGAAVEIEMALKQQKDFEEELKMLFYQTNNADVWESIQERVRQMDAEDKAEAEREKIREIKRRRQQKEWTDAAIAIVLLALIVGAGGWAFFKFMAYCAENSCSL